MKKDETSSQGGGNQGGAATQTDPNPTGASHTQANEEGKSPPANPNASSTAAELAADAQARARGERPKPPNDYPQTSRQKAGVGRALHAYSPAWTGPRPATVVICHTGRESLKAGSLNLVNANVQFDGATEANVLEYVRRSNSGNTFTCVKVYDALTPEQRAEAMPELVSANEWRASWNKHTSPPVHFEWPALD